MTERRYQRFRVKVPLYISLAENVYRKMVRIECRDLSTGGLSFETNEEIPLDANSHLVISKVGDLPESACIEGRVVHRSQNPTTGRYWVGVEFTRFNGVSPKDIEDCIDCWEPDTGPSKEAPDSQS